MSVNSDYISYQARIKILFDFIAMLEKDCHVDEACRPENERMHGSRDAGLGCLGWLRRTFALNV